MLIIVKVFTIIALVTTVAAPAPTVELASDVTPTINLVIGSGGSGGSIPAN